MTNSSRSLRRLLPSLALTVVIVSAPATAGVSRGALVRRQDDIESSMGAAVAKEIEAETPVVRDPLLTAWVDMVGKSVAATSGRPNVHYRFTVLDADDVNAVSAPGGYVYVNRGTLAFVHSEDELATVLAHEVGHIAGRHAMKQLGSQILGSILLAAFHTFHAETLRAVGGAAGSLALLKYSRDQENDADSRGLKSATAAGYDGSAMPALFQRMDQLERERPDRLESYFLTHPPLVDRIKRIEAEPGCQPTAINLAALARGLESRGLYREAAIRLSAALALDSSLPGAAARLASLKNQLHEVRSVEPISVEDRTAAINGLVNARANVTENDKATVSYAEAARRKRIGMTADLDACVRALDLAATQTSWRDQTRYRELLRMARTFNSAVRTSGNIGAAAEMAGQTLADTRTLVGSLQSSIQQGDRDALAPAGLVGSTSQTAFASIATAMRTADRTAADLADGVRTLRQAAENLESSYRTPFGFTSGEFSLLDLESDSAQQAIASAEQNSRAVIEAVAKGDVELQAVNINFTARHIAPGDAAISKLVGHYLSTNASAIAKAAASAPWGAVVLDTAVNFKLPVAAAAKPAAMAGTSQRHSQEVPHWRDIAVLFHLIENDIKRELPNAAG